MVEDREAAALCGRKGHRGDGGGTSSSSSLSLSLSLRPLGEGELRINRLNRLSGMDEKVAVSRTHSQSYRSKEEKGSVRSLSEISMTALKYS